jgi:hypothetical protein
VDGGRVSWWLCRHHDGGCCAADCRAQPTARPHATHLLFSIQRSGGGSRAERSRSSRRTWVFVAHFPLPRRHSMVSDCVGEESHPRLVGEVQQRPAPYNYNSIQIIIIQIQLKLTLNTFKFSTLIKTTVSTYWKRSN